MKCLGTLKFEDVLPAGEMNLCHSDVVRVSTYKHVCVEGNHLIQGIVSSDYRLVFWTSLAVWSSNIRVLCIPVSSTVAP